MAAGRAQDFDTGISRAASAPYPCRGVPRAGWSREPRLSAQGASATADRRQPGHRGRAVAQRPAPPGGGVGPRARRRRVRRARGGRRGRHPRAVHPLRHGRRDGGRDRRAAQGTGPARRAARAPRADPAGLDRGRPALLGRPDRAPADHLVPRRADPLGQLGLRQPLPDQPARGGGVQRRGPGPAERPRRHGEHRDRERAVVRGVAPARGVAARLRRHQPAAAGGRRGGDGAARADRRRHPPAGRGRHGDPLPPRARGPRPARDGRDQRARSRRPAGGALRGRGQPLRRGDAGRARASSSTPSRTG